MSYLLVMALVECLVSKKLSSCVGTNGLGFSRGFFILVAERIAFSWGSQTVKIIGKATLNIPWLRTFWILSKTSELLLGTRPTHGPKGLFA
jgi:hypothetical protein